MKKAYSYARFSSVGQREGLSIERQLQIATDYHARNLAHLPLDTSRCDEGFSAYRGKQISKGSLGHFLAEIKAGTVEPGSVLIVENLDRISRQGPKLARKILEQIVDNGTEIHVVNISKVLRYGWENRIEDSVPVDCELSRAFTESSYKSNRIGHSWRTNKAKTAEGRVLTSKLPSWLKVKNGKIVEIPEKVAIVRAVFAHAANGLGCKKIRKAMNGANLSQTWISKTLSNRAVLGEFRPHRLVDGKRVWEEGKDEVIFNYYPRIISEEEWVAARAEIDRKNCMDSETRKLTHGGARDSDRANNLFSGLIFDGDRSMWFQRKGKGNAFFVSACNTDGPSHRLRYDRFEKAFLEFLGDLDWRTVAGEGEPAEVKTKAAQLNSLTNDLATLKAKMAARTAVMEETLDPGALKVLAGQVAKFEEQAAELEKTRQMVAVEVGNMRMRLASMDSAEELLHLIRFNTPEANDVRLRLRSEIRRKVSRIELHFDTGLEGVVDADADIWLINGAHRRLGFHGESWIAASMEPGYVFIQYAFTPPPERIPSPGTS
jgi:hypothetical protein